MKNIYRFSLLLFMCTCTCITHAQIAVVPAGGDGDQVAFSVGQSVAGLAVGETGSAEIGVQQTFTLLVSGLHEIPAMAGTTIAVYPNPTSSMLQINVVSTIEGDVDYELFSIQGQLLESKRFDPKLPMEIDMTGYPQGTYTLRLLQNGKVGAGCQVIKK